jgi:hypothetical protein
MYIYIYVHVYKFMYIHVYIHKLYICLIDIYNTYINYRLCIYQLSFMYISIIVYIYIYMHIYRPPKLSVISKLSI